MRYFPQHVLLCTSTVHDQLGDIETSSYVVLRRSLLLFEIQLVSGQF